MAKASGRGGGRGSVSRETSMGRASRGVLSEVVGWFRPAGLAELHKMLRAGEDPAERRRQARREGGGRVRRARPAVFDNAPAIVLIAAAVLLTGMEYTGYSSHFNRWFTVAGHDPMWGELYGLLWWAFIRFAGFVVLPMLVVVLVLRERLVDFGLRLQGAAKHLPVYGVLFAIVAPLVLLFSFTASFQSTYPFYRLAGRSFFDFIVWELAYFVQFLGVEFFFRGFLLSGTKRQLGAYSVFVSVVPYCMIHFGKPLPETLGAIVAGTVLGVLALRTGSIWAGFLIHVSVALSMDFLSVLHRTILP